MVGGESVLDRLGVMRPGRDGVRGHKRKEDGGRQKGGVTLPQQGWKMVGG